MIGDQIAAPDDLAVLEIETQGVSLFAEGVDGAIVNRRCRTRAALVVTRVESATIGMLPEDLSGPGREAPDGVGLLSRDGAVAHRDHAVPGDGNGAETSPDLGVPQDGKFRGQRLGDCFGGDSVVGRPAPVRPVGGVREKGD